MRIYPDKAYKEALLRASSGTITTVRAKAKVGLDICEIIECDACAEPRKFTREWDLVVNNDVVLTMRNQKELERLQRLINDTLDEADFDTRPQGT